MTLAKKYELEFKDEHFESAYDWCIALGKFDNGIEMRRSANNKLLIKFSDNSFYVPNATKEERDEAIKTAFN